MTPLANSLTIIVALWLTAVNTSQQPYQQGEAIGFVLVSLLVWTLGHRELYAQ